MVTFPLALSTWKKFPFELINFFNNCTEEELWLDSTGCDSNNKTNFASAPVTVRALPWEHLSLYPFCAEIHCFGCAQTHEAVGLNILIVDEGGIEGP